MDQASFDRIARVLGGAVSRRAGLAAVAGSLVWLGARGAGMDMDAASTSRRGAGRPGAQGPCGNGSRKENTCTKDSECCTGVCNMAAGKKNRDGTGRCRCRKKGGSCTADRNCCNGMQCLNKVCGGSSPQPTVPPPPPPTPTPTPNPCPDARVCASGCEFTTVQDAINAALPSLVVIIGPGTYVEDLLINKNLTLEGCGEVTLKDTGANQRTIKITGGSTVVLKNLTIDGTGSVTVTGGGIDSDGQLILSGSTKVTNGSEFTDGYGGCVYSHEIGNSVTMMDTASVDTCFANFGGGVYVADQGSLTMSGSAKIVKSIAQMAGGGASVYTTITMNDASEISGCSATTSGGGIYSVFGTLTMNGTSSVKSNSAGSFGGGMYLYDAEVIMNDSATVSLNESSYGGGGVFMFYDSLGSSVTLNGSATITGNNVTTGAGGGVYSPSPNNTLTVNGGSITGNSPDNCAGGTLTC